MSLLICMENLKPFLTGPINALFIIGTIVSIITIILVYIIRLDRNACIEDEIIIELNTMANKLFKYCIIITICIQFLGALMPTTKQVAMIYIIPKIINNEQIKELPDNMLNLFNESIKELTSMIKEEKASVIKGGVE